MRLALLPLCCVLLAAAGCESCVPVPSPPDAGADAGREAHPQGLIDAGAAGPDDIDDGGRGAGVQELVGLVWAAARGDNRQTKRVDDSADCTHPAFIGPPLISLWTKARTRPVDGVAVGCESATAAP